RHPPLSLLFWHLRYVRCHVLHSFPTRRSSDLFSQQRLWPEAEAELRRAIALDPRSLPAQVLLAETLAQSGKPAEAAREARRASVDRKSTRLNSSHDQISYAVSGLKKKL